MILWTRKFFASSGSSSKSADRAHTLDSAPGKRHPEPTSVLPCSSVDRFTYLHPEKLPSAIERYSKEVKRVLGVLDKVLGAEPNKEWLVGDRIIYADLAFVPWNDRLDVTLGVPADKKFEGFPNVKKWHERMIKRPSWIKAMKLRARLMDEHGLDWNGMPKGTTNFQEYQKSVAQDEAQGVDGNPVRFIGDVARPRIP